MTFVQAMAKAAKRAESENKLMYMYYGNQDDDWRVTERFWSDWLFRAYPGGRKELSAKGSQIALDKGIVEGAQ